MENNITQSYTYLKNNCPS